MMDWCKNNRVSPANSHFWKKAEQEYKKTIKKENKNGSNRRSVL